MEASEYCLIITTTNTKENANIITKVLLEEKLVACVQSTVVQSTYHWEEKIIESKEIQLQMKSKRSHFKKVQKSIEHLHNYDVPEIIMVPIEDANLSYLQWLEEETI